MRCLLNSFLAVAFLSLAGAVPTPRNDLRGSKSHGGTGGRQFDDGLDPRMPAHPKLKSITLRGGERVDDIDFKVNDQTFSHGGSGGESKTLEIKEGQYIKTVEMCWTTLKFKWVRRLKWMKVTTNNGEYIQAGERMGRRSCATLTAPDGFGLVGGHGRAGNEMNRFGAVWAPL